MRALLILPLLLLPVACQRAEQPAATADADGKIDCRIGADTQFNRFCTLERTRNEQGLLLTVHKPDGGFRRLIATRDGRGVTAADGAEQAQVQIIGDNLIEVGIAGDSFRLPARIGPVAQSKQ
jgi:hypothetical protein